VHALGGDEQLLADLVAVGVAEVDDGQGSATARVVDDVLKDEMVELELVVHGKLYLEWSPKLYKLSF